MEDQNKEIYNANNEIPSENLCTRICDDIDIEILNSTESDPLNTLRDSILASSNNRWQSISPIKKCEFTEMSQMHIAYEEDVKTIAGYLNTQQEDSTNERSNNSREMYTGTSESSGKLYIDESVEESLKQEECDKVLSSEEDNLYINTLQDSTFDVITCNSTEGIPSLMKNTIEAVTSQNFVIEAQNAETLNEEFLEPKKILPEISFEDEWNMEENI